MKTTHLFQKNLKCPTMPSLSNYKRKALFEVGLYDEDFYAAEDYELWSRFDKNGYKLANLQKVLLKYRIPYNEARNKMNWKYNFLVKVRYFSFDKRILLSLIGLVQALLF